MDEDHIVLWFIYHLFIYDYIIKCINLGSFMKQPTDLERLHQQSSTLRWKFFLKSFSVFYLSFTILYGLIFEGTEYIFTE